MPVHNTSLPEDGKNDYRHNNRNGSHSRQSYKDLLPIFSRNLKNLFPGHNIKNGAELATVLGFYPAAVQKWLRGERLPAADQLMIIADFFEVTVEWLLSGHGQKERHHIRTYSQAFITLKFMIYEGYISKEAVNDPFLKYMLSEDARISKDIKNQKMIDDWYDALLNDFDMPLLPKEITTYFDDTLAEHKEIFPSSTYEKIFGWMEEFYMEAVRSSSGVNTYFIESEDGKEILFPEWLQNKLGETNQTDTFEIPEGFDTPLN